MDDDGTRNWEGSFSIDFSLLNGLSKKAVSTIRRLSQVKNMFSDTEAARKAAAAGDPVIYEFFELDAPENPGDLAFGTSITYPGKIGKEYYMTKGHFHAPIDTAEVYYALSGEGFMVMENPEGDSVIRSLSPGTAVYVPKRYAHRSVNTGSAPLVTFFVFRADAGHDYASIETKGFRRLVIEGKDGKPQVIDNPKWKG